MPMKEYRCNLPDCNALLFKGEFTGTIERICKCGAVHRITSAPEVKPDGQRVTPLVPYQDRMRLTKKKGNM